MEKSVKSCFIPDCQNTSSHKTLYPFLIDTNDINSWLVGIGSPELVKNVPEDNRRLCEQYFLCPEHMNFLDTIKDEKIEKKEENEENPEEDPKEHDADDEDEEESGPDCLSQQLSTLSVSQPKNEDPEELEDSILDILEAEKSQDFIELKNFCSQNLESIFSLIPDDTTNLCRLCGKSTEDSIQIFSEQNEGSEISLLEKIRYYLPIKLEVDDDLPKVICQECSELLEKSHDLAMRALATEHFLTASEPEDEVKKETEDVLGALGIVPVDRDDQITSTQADDFAGCSQETLSDAGILKCSQSSLITSDEDEGPYTKFEGLKQLRTYGKKRPLSLDTENESAAKKKREEPVFEKWYKCNSCPASSPDEDVIKFHKNRHRLNKPVLFWCNICATEFPKESIFSNHVLSAHKEESQGLSLAHKCTNCHRVYSLKATALMHYLVKCAVHPIQEFGSLKCAEEVYIRYAYVCEHCWKGFAYASSLNQHRNKEHPSVIPWNGQIGIDDKEKRERIMDIFGIKNAFVCKFCAHIFTSLESYIYHGREHADGQYKCTTCETLFPSFEEFKEHRETQHDYRMVFRETTKEKLTSRIPFGEEMEVKREEQEGTSVFRMLMENLCKFEVLKSPGESFNSP